MFIGHFGMGMIAKKIDSKPSLGTFFLATQFIDLLWPIFLLIGIEHVKIDPGNTAFTPLNFIYYPFSHGLISVIIWSVLFSFVYFIKKRDVKSAFILGIIVSSHWVLDFITHRPDLPLTLSNNFKVGLGLWNSVLFTLIVEGTLFISGFYLYLKSTTAKNKKGAFGLWGLIIFLIIIYIMNIIGPPPPSESAIGVVGLFLWLIVGWAYWIDRNRMLKN